MNGISTVFWLFSNFFKSPKFLKLDFAAFRLFWPKNTLLYHIKKKYLGWYFFFIFFQISRFFQKHYYNQQNKEENTQDKKKISQFLAKIWSNFGQFGTKNVISCFFTFLVFFRSRSRIFFAKQGGRELVWYHDLRPNSAKKGGGS